jgi:hypothetical protein
MALHPAVERGKRDLALRGVDMVMMKSVELTDALVVLADSLSLQ